MHKHVFLLLSLVGTLFACAQKASSVISAAEVRRIESTLASDEMKGRRPGTPEMEKAAAFIGAEFKKAGLQPLSGDSYLQEFYMVRNRLAKAKAELNGQDFDATKMIAVTSQAELKVDEGSGYEIVTLNKGEDLRTRVNAIMGTKKNTVVFLDSSFAGNFSRLAGLNRNGFESAAKNDGANVIFVLAPPASTFKFKVENTVERTRYFNVVGVLPGRSRKNEYVIFSGHFDHLGVARQPVNGDSIYNGANDDAAGTTAVILLADYFHRQNNNERSLVFAAFTAEESGGFGSQYFSRQFDPAQVVAMFNIEMIGTESKWGTNSAYITGYDKTNMGEILQRNLKGSSFSFYPDPYPQENLFYRSDNATLARLGVPAHTVSTAKMEDEPNYHKVSDEVSTLDIDNMSRIIEAIATSSRSIISGADTPTRVKTDTLK